MADIGKLLRSLFSSELSEESKHLYIGLLSQNGVSGVVFKEIEGVQKIHVDNKPINLDEFLTKCSEAKQGEQIQAEDEYGKYLSALKTVKAKGRAEGYTLSLSEMRGKALEKAQSEGVNLSVAVSKIEEAGILGDFIFQKQIVDPNARTSPITRRLVNYPTEDFEKFLIEFPKKDEAKGAVDSLKNKGMLEEEAVKFLNNKIIGKKNSAIMLDVTTSESYVAATNLVNSNLVSKDKSIT